MVDSIGQLGPNFDLEDSVSEQCLLISNNDGLYDQVLSSITGTCSNKDCQGGT